MTTPEQALEQARAAAAQARAAGAYPDAAAPGHPGPPGPEELPLFEWALIHPDLRDVRSTRRFGAPITALKHWLLRLLDQYHVELIAHQTRFNSAAAARLAAVEKRVAELEARAGEADAPGGDHPAPSG